MFERPEFWQLLLALGAVATIFMQARAARINAENQERVIKVETESKARLLELETKSREQDSHNDQINSLIDALRSSTAAQNEANRIANEERMKWRETVETNAEAKLALASAVEVNTSTLATIKSDMADRFLNVGSVVMQAKQEAVGALEMKIDDNTAEVMERMDALKSTVDAALKRMEEGAANWYEVKRVLEGVAKALEDLPKRTTTELPAVPVTPPASDADHDQRNRAQLAALQAANDKRATGETAKADDPPTPKVDEPPAA